MHSREEKALAVTHDVVESYVKQTLKENYPEIWKVLDAKKSRKLFLNQLHDHEVETESRLVEAFLDDHPKVRKYIRTIPLQKLWLEEVLLSFSKKR